MTNSKEFCDKILKGIGKPLTRTDALKLKKCAWCGGEASEFTDDLSKREYAISALCQKCQDDVFKDI